MWKDASANPTENQHFSLKVQWIFALILLTLTHCGAWFIWFISETSTSRGRWRRWSSRSVGSLPGSQVVDQQGDQCGDQQQDHDDGSSDASCVVSFWWGYRGDTQLLVTQAIVKTMRTHYSIVKGQYCCFLFENWHLKNVSCSVITCSVTNHKPMLQVCKMIATGISS